MPVHSKAISFAVLRYKAECRNILIPCFLGIIPARKFHTGIHSIAHYSQRTNYMRLGIMRSHHAQKLNIALGEFCPACFICAAVAFIVSTQIYHDYVSPETFGVPWEVLHFPTAERRFAKAHGIIIVGYQHMRRSFACFRPARDHAPAAVGKQAVFSPQRLRSFICISLCAVFRSRAEAMLYDLIINAVSAGYGIAYELDMQLLFFSL